MQRAFVFWLLGLLLFGGLAVAQDGAQDSITTQSIQPRPTEPLRVTPQAIRVRRVPTTYGGASLSTFFARPGFGVLIGSDGIGDTRGLGVRGDAAIHTDGTFTLGANILYKTTLSASEDGLVRGYLGAGPRLAVTGNLAGNDGAFFGLGALVGGEYDLGSLRPFAELDLNSYFDRQGAVILPVFRIGLTIPF